MDHPDDTPDIAKLAKRSLYCEQKAAEFARKALEARTLLDDARHMRAQHVWSSEEMSDAIKAALAHIDGSDKQDDAFGRVVHSSPRLWVEATRANLTSYTEPDTSEMLIKLRTPLMRDGRRAGAFNLDCPEFVIRAIRQLGYTTQATPHPNGSSVIIQLKKKGSRGPRRKL